MNSTITSADAEELWSLSLKKDHSTRVEVADADGDGTDEVGITSASPRGPTTYGIAEEGTWVWQEQSSADIQVPSSADVDGDETPEMIFKAKVASSWVRPYTYSGDYLWDGQTPDWPGSAFPVDYDGDGKAEIAALSGYNGYFRVFDDDGSIVWDVQATPLVDKLHDFRDVVGGEVPELLTPTGRAFENTGTGLQLVRRDGKSGATRLWSYGPTERTRAKFTDVDGDGSLEVLAAYPERGEVRAVDTDGSELWIESVGLSGKRASIFDINGDGVADAAVWSGTEIALFNGLSRETSKLTTNSPIQLVRQFTDGKLLAGTRDSVLVVTPEDGIVGSRSIEGEIKDIAVGDVDGDDQPEIVLGYGDRVVAIPNFSDDSSGDGTQSFPSASFDTVPARPQTSEQTIFEASASDSDGTIAAYNWDLDDDGEFEKSGQRVEYSFQTPGQQTVTLEVTDDDGLTTTATQTFDVPLRLAPEKRDLAERIDEYSTTGLNDASRADQRITEITDAVQRGDLDTEEAEDAVERLLRAEQLTEAVLENIGPSPEDEEGEPEVGESYNLSRASAKPVLQTALELLVGVAGATGGGTAVSKSSSSFLSLGGVGKLLKQIGTEAVSGAVSSVLDQFFGTFTDGKQTAKQSLTASAGTIAGNLSTNSEVTSGDIVTAVTTEITPIVETTATGLRLFLEQDLSTPLGTIPVSTVSIDNSLDYLYGQISTDTASGGLPGTVEGARAISETKTGAINGKAQSVSNTIEDITELGENSGLFTALADLFDPGEVRPIDALEVLLGIAETVVGSITDAIKAGVGVQGLIELGVQQALGTFLVVQGRESL